MQIVHEPASDRVGSDREPPIFVDQATNDGTPSILADRAELADGLVKKGLGLMFRRSLPDGYALGFRFDRPASRSIHMLCVFVPLDVVWVCDGVVERVERLAPWRGFARARADLILEFPAGVAAAVEPGDRLRIERD